MSTPFNASAPFDEEALFNSLAWSPKEIRSHRKGIISFCSRCGKSDADLGQRLRKCSKCQTAAYCSKESQTRHWPTHKRVWGEAGIPKLVKTLMSNPILFTKLESCFVPAFDLANRTRYDEMLLDRVDVAVEPSNIDDFADILLQEESSKKWIEGMPQVNAFIPNTDPRRLSGRREEVWRKERAMTDSAGYHADTVVIMEVIHADSQMSMAIPLRLSPAFIEALNPAISAGLINATGIPGEPSRVSYTTRLLWSEPGREYHAAPRLSAPRW
ncbi:Zinc finger, MYND-type [Mycena sanguinolenta]|uniref:Zinc finger, MYND-type n=1 Tax=Mycena sanguinolenta TaxID=230812 RepID=A0A8H6X9L7_9AGAR|nr:Zinc finger, MYND-type [Mycena sanguinolenta]